MSIENFLILVGAIFLGYVAIGAFLTRAVRPVRAELADLGRRLIEADISAEEKKRINWLLDTAYSRWFMVGAVVAFPGTLLGALIRPQSVRSAESDDSPVMRLADRPDGLRLLSLHMQSVMAANPIMTAFFIVEVVFALPLLFFVGLGASLGSFIINTMTKNEHGSGNGKFA